MHTYLYAQADYLAQFIFKKDFAFSSKARLGRLPISAFCKQAIFCAHFKGRIFGFKIFVSGTSFFLLLRKQGQTFVWLLAPKKWEDSNLVSNPRSFLL